VKSLRRLLHFLALGALLLALDAAFGAPRSPPPGPPPSDEELLVRAARARRLQHGDPVVRRRLVANMRFATRDPQRSDASLLSEAFELGMDESDVVVRRRLAQLARLEIEREARLGEPGEAELAAWLARRAERFEVPARVRISQVFLGASPLPLPAEPPTASRRELAASFGEAFAEAVFALEPGAWHAPIRSSYGDHRVRVDERWPARTAELAEVRSAVREAWLEERAAAALEERLRWLRARR